MRADLRVKNNNSVYFIAASLFTPTNFSLWKPLPTPYPAFVLKGTIVESFIRDNYTIKILLSGVGGRREGWTIEHFQQIEEVEQIRKYHVIKLEKKGSAKGEDGQPVETYDVRHVLLSTGYKVPSALDGREVPVKTFVRSKLEAEKESEMIKQVVAANNIDVPADFTVPTAPPATKPAAKRPPVKKRPIKKRRS